MERNSSEIKQPFPDNAQTILIVACGCVFAGRAWAHLFLDIPLRTVLWNQALMEDIVNNRIGISWNQYVSSVVWDARINLLIRIGGVFYLGCTLFCIGLFFGFKKGYGILVAGGVALFLLAVLFFIDKFYRVGELIEFTSQWASPILLFLFITDSMTKKASELLIRLAVALTFTGHGLYAVGFYPVPGNFIDMIIMTFGFTQSGAIKLLAFAGWMDFLISVAIFVPAISRYACIYAFAWGSLTAIARVWANFDADLGAPSIYQWVPELLVRVPNALLPLALLMIAGKEKPAGMANHENVTSG